MRVKGSRPPGPTITLTADAVQATVALVTETATATAGSTIAWTLQELAPGGTWADATVLLSGTSGTSVTWTPAGLGYVYQVQAVATLNAQTATARRSVRCGQGQASLAWTQVGSWDFSAAASVAAPATDGGSITVAGLSIGTDNGDGAGGRGTILNTNGTGLRLAAPVSSAVAYAGATSSTRTAPIALFTAAALGLTIDANSDVLALFQIAGFGPADPTAYFQMGSESAAAPGGSGASGRCEVFGPGRVGANQCPAETYQDASGTGVVTPPTTTGWAADTWRVIGVRLSGVAGVTFYYSTTTNAMSSATPLAELTLFSEGSARYRGTVPSDARFVAALSYPSDTAPTEGVIQALRVLRRAATLT